eukprot:12113164-Heterocapsa_arctica.AAC.1
MKDAWSSRCTLTLVIFLLSVIFYLFLFTICCLSRQSGMALNAFLGLLGPLLFSWTLPLMFYIVRLRYTDSLLVNLRYGSFLFYAGSMHMQSQLEPDKTYRESSVQTYAEGRIFMQHMGFIDLTMAECLLALLAWAALFGGVSVAVLHVSSRADARSSNAH